MYLATNITFTSIHIRNNLSIVEGSTYHIGLNNTGRMYKAVMTLIVCYNSDQSSNG